MPNILFLSDNDKFRSDLSEQISLNIPDFNVQTNEAEGTYYDIILIDENYDKFCALRKNRQCPVYLFAPAAADYDEDNVVFKPLLLNSFLNLLRSGINIFENSRDGYLNFNDYELRPLKKEILNKRNREVVKLTEKEVSIIKYLYKAQDRIVGKNELLQEVWEYNPDATTHTIETHIYRLRQKVEHEDTSAQIILTSDGGYQLKV